MATTPQLMRQVLLALLPGLAVLVSLQGSGVLLNLAWASLGALGGEALSLRLRQRPAWPALQDGSALVSAGLLAVCLPPLLPGHVPLLGGLFATVVVKQLYGGLGHNLFNPAMAGYAFLLLAFPLEMTRWPAMPLPFETSLHHSLTGTSLPWDTLSHATPLDQLKQSLRQAQVPNLSPPAPWLALAWLVGGLWLLGRGVIPWLLPLATLLGFGLAAGLGSLIHPAQADVGWHLQQGGILLAAFFIITDPVTAPAGRLAQGLYASGIGALAYLLRAQANAPEALAFAVLLGNALAPALELACRPRR